MKKTLAALAVLGAFSGAAFAQSNVTVYGLVDGGLQYVNPSRSGTDATFGIASGQQSGSRFGLKGSENLGNGIKAVFQLENGFSMDTGVTTQGTKDSKGNDVSRLFGRQASLGLVSSFGEVHIGRFGSLGSGTGSIDMFGKLDPFSTGFKDAGVQATQAFTSLRVDNAVAFKTANYAGFQGGLLYSFNTNLAEVAGSDNNTRLAGVAATYTLGKLWTGVSYEVVEQAATAAAKEDDKVLKLGVNYDFGMVKPMFSYSKAEGAQKFDKLNFAGTGVKSDAYMIGAQAPIFGGTLMASYQFVDIKASALTANEKAEREVFSVGYDYPFSKRTNLYGVYSYSKGDKAFDEGKFTAGTNGNLDSAIDLANRSVLQVGLRHKF